ncbi:MAG: hypothetical protein KDD56_07055 [Bdellovibrionales bacterium]|nr:hypothetical protein [Bdellovibrionales bacterium]
MLSQFQDQRDIARTSALHNPLLMSFKGLRGKVALFGGSFDPFHNDHLEIGRLVKERHEIDSLI